MRWEDGECKFETKYIKVIESTVNAEEDKENVKALKKEINREKLETKCL